MAIATSHKVVGCLADGQKIIKTVRTGGLGCSGGIYINVPLSKVTDILSFVPTGCVEPYTCMEYIPALTSGNQVVIACYALASGTTIGNATSGQTVSGEFTMYTIGV